MVPKQLEHLRGKSRTIEVTLDDSLLWSESNELSLLSLASTTGITSVVFKLAYDLVQTFLTEDLTSVIIEASIRHVSPVQVRKVVAVGVKILDVVENKLKIRGVVMSGDTKILETEFIRAVVSKNYLRRISVAKTS
ncbi:MAG: thioesterase [Thermotogaceae bacterium]|nr:thioesterase [Thermotogaceae bacterium]